MEAGKKFLVIFALHGIGYDEQYMLNLVEDVKEEYILMGIRGKLTYKEGYAYYYLKGYGNPERQLFDRITRGRFETTEKVHFFITKILKNVGPDPISSKIW
jgi:predicted esterase